MDLDLFPEVIIIRVQSNCNVDPKLLSLLTNPILVDDQASYLYRILQTGTVAI